MGLTKTHHTFRFSEETLMQIDAIKSALSPFAEDRSSTLRIIVQVVYALIFTPATLADALDAMQRLHGHTLSYNGQMAFHFEGQGFRPRLGASQ